jgi:hypothetical protein
MSQNIEGKVVVITGASSGLGEATARTLSAQGAAVVLGARRGDRIQALARELIGGGGKAIAATTDVTDRAQVKNLVDAAVEAYGRIDVMINNAGLMPQAPLERLKIDVRPCRICSGRNRDISSTSRRWPATRSDPASRSMRPPSLACAPSLRGCVRSEVLQHPHHRHFARRRGHRIAGQRDRSGCRREGSCVLRGRREPRGFVRAPGCFRHHPAGRRGYQWPPRIAPKMPYRSASRMLPPPTGPKRSTSPTSVGMRTGSTRNPDMIPGSNEMARSNTQFAPFRHSIMRS